MGLTLTFGGGGTPAEGKWDGSGNLELSIGGTTTFQIDDLGHENWGLNGVIGVTLTGDIDAPGDLVVEGGDLDLGASGTAGSLDIFPTTAAKGKVRVTAPDNAGDTVTDVAFAAQAGARTYTTPDAGASASYLMSEGSQAVNGVQTFAGANVHSAANLFSAGAAAAAVAQRLGASATEGWEIRVIDETVTCDAVSKDLTEDIPDGAVILSVQGNKETAGAAGGTTTNWGIGTAGNPDLYSPTVGVLTLDGKIDHIPDYAVNSGAVDIQIHGVTAAGAIGDTAPGGTARVRIVYAALNSLDNA